MLTMSLNCIYVVCNTILSPVADFFWQNILLDFAALLEHIASWEIQNGPKASDLAHPPSYCLSLLVCVSYLHWNQWVFSTSWSHIISPSTVTNHAQHSFQLGILMPSSSSEKKIILKGNLGRKHIDNMAIHIWGECASPVWQFIGAPNKVSDSLNNRNLFSHCSGAKATKIKITAGRFLLRPPSSMKKNSINK